MPVLLNDTLSVILIATAVVLLFAFGYAYVILSSSRRIVQEQHRRIDELRRSEERYKALFMNSLAGMMKFSFSPFIVLETNQTILEMFNVTTDYELQRLLSDLPNGQTKRIETVLHAKGTIDAMEIEFPTPTGIKRRFLFSAKREEGTNLAHAVVILMTAERLIG
ncbi:MAG: hypothetical protein HUU02_03815 [Bacteroidetes bacterium]|nr:hypothetical protein [Bacteroidota bacterium]